MSSPEQIMAASEIIRDGGTVVFPTETVYGLGANALDASAVAKIYEIKRRPVDHPLIVHVLNLEEARLLVTSVSAIAEKLARKFWPGPLTLVFNKNEKVADFVTGGQSTVAIRVPAHPVARQLLEASGVPIAAPSANLFGKISATLSEHLADLRGRADYILEGETCAVGLESTIVDVSGEGAILLRPGGITVEEILQCTAELKMPPAGYQTKVPGTLSRHYAPKTPMYFLESLTQLPAGRLGLLCLTDPGNSTHFCEVEALSPDGDLNRAAAKLFAALRNLDDKKLDAIIALKFPERGLGIAINDRLRRAAAY